MSIAAKALICDEKQNFSMTDVILPEPKEDQILVRASFSGVSIGTEFALIHNKISWGPYPLCTGYMATGIVESVGAEIDNFRKGDQIYYRANDEMKAENGANISCVCGTHCSHAVLTPNSSHGAAKLPQNAPLDITSMFVMPAVGLFGVDMSNPRMGETVVVFGAGLIGLGVIAACSQRGCVVIAVDLDDKRLELASQMGADHIVNSNRQETSAEIKKISGIGADIVFECTGQPKCVNEAIELCKIDGSFVCQGNYGAAPLPLNFLSAHGRKLKMFFPCDDGLQPCRRAVVKNMAMDVLKWGKTVTHRIKYQDAAEIYEQINAETLKDAVGILIEWSGKGEK